MQFMLASILSNRDSEWNWPFRGVRAVGYRDTGKTPGPLDRFPPCRRGPAEGADGAAVLRVRCTASLHEMTQDRPHPKGLMRRTGGRPFAG